VDRPAHQQRARTQTLPAAAPAQGPYVVTEYIEGQTLAQWMIDADRAASDDVLENGVVRAADRGNCVGGDEDAALRAGSWLGGNSSAKAAIGSRA
jgi:hypothetical protein